LGNAARRRVEAGWNTRQVLGERLAASARGRLREMEARLSGLGRLCSQLAPERTLERGFTLTRDVEGRSSAGRTRSRPATGS